MGNVYLKTCAFILSFGILVPSQLVYAEGCADLEGTANAAIAECNANNATNPVGTAHAAQQKFVDSFGVCWKYKDSQYAAGKGKLGIAESAKGNVAGKMGTVATTTNTSSASTSLGTTTSAESPAAIATAASSACTNLAQSSAASESMLAATSKQVESACKGAVKTGYKPDPKPAQLQTECASSVADSKGIMDSLGKAALPLAALAAGALGGYMLGKSSGGDDAEDDADDATETAAVEPAAATEDTCPANTTKDAAGLCVVDSEDDTCYAADGTTEDKTKVRDSKGVCVSTSSLCQTGYDYDTVNKVCKKSTCASGYSENEAGECISNGTGGNTIAVGTPDPIIGEDPAKTEDEETLAEKLAKNKAKTSGSGSTSSSGGSARNAAAAPSSSKGSGSFQSSGGGTGGGGSGSSFSGGGFAANGGGADGAAGKDSDVQYQPVKWANPKKDRPLRNVLRK